jgi:hypothetical protein
MAYGRKSLMIIPIVLLVLGSLVLGAFMFLRFAVPNIVARVLSEDGSDFMSPEDRMELEMAMDEVMLVLERYGLEREEAIAELEALNGRELADLWNSMLSDPPATPADAVAYAVDRLGIEGVDTEALSQDVSMSVSQDEYEAFFQSSELEEIDPRVINFMLPTIRDTLVEMLKSQE